MAIIRFTHHEVKPILKNRSAVKEHIRFMLQNEGYSANRITFIFCTDEFLHSLNVQFLDHDTYTDILTFRLSENDEPLIAEIYISVERVAENAHTHNVTIQEELLRVVFHGVLHLCGYEDHSQETKQEMRKMENFYLASFVSRETSESKKKG